VTVADCDPCAGSADRRGLRGLRDRQLRNADRADLLRGSRV